MKAALALGVALIMSGCAGMAPAADVGQPVEFVLDAPGKTKDQIFSASKSWIAETFVSGKAVIDDADKDSGRIIAKGIIDKPCSSLQCVMEMGWQIGFTMRIDSKDGKVRITYTNPVVITPASSGSLLGSAYISGSARKERPMKFSGDIADAKIKFQTLSDSLKNYISTDSVAEKDW